MKNGDLVVKDVGLSQSGRADTLDIAAFTDALDMVNWEFAAYNAYGQKRCDDESIETLADLFGDEFNAKFRARHKWLLKYEELKDAENERAELHIRIEKLKQELQELG